MSSVLSDDREGRHVPKGHSERRPGHGQSGSRPRASLRRDFEKRARPPFESPENELVSPPSMMLPMSAAERHVLIGRTNRNGEPIFAALRLLV
jgi:hypothetical protein